MRNFARVIIFVLFAGLFTGAAAQNSLIVKQANGSLKGTALTSLSKITFSTGNMLVRKTDATTDSYVLADVSKVTFGIFSGINDVSSNSPALSIYPNPATSFIQLRNLPEAKGFNICIYSLAGSRLMQQYLTSTTSTIDVSTLNKGMYLLNVNGSTLKFIKQ